ncbi:MAG TPA: polysaccharide pyruvyl transferase family protein, partial [Candidatus Dormibacteraeota bacterium]
MKAYWAIAESAGGRGNFGDVLTPLLFERLCGIRLKWVEREEAELIAIGSLADTIPRGYAGIVLGTGCMFDVPIELDAAKVLALRGVLTARLAGLHPPLLADLGLLASDLAPVVDRDVPIGTVRHAGDPRPPIGLALDPLGDPEEMIADAARCQRIVSSSLHGLILADALGIPNMWDPHPWVRGHGFKFRDYASAF